MELRLGPRDMMEMQDYGLVVQRVFAMKDGTNGLLVSIQNTSTFVNL